jgi:kynurenine formamidase
MLVRHSVSALAVGLALPIKITGGSGAPARIVAILP